MGLNYVNKVALTGSIARLQGKSSKVKIAVMGELDAVVCPGHPQAVCGKLETKQFGR
ncbi:hypothetical protein SDC9_73574 [bioreactor metagenome]|uniref:Uncharacterized protein n=1 Tax=bioreactor metagenome TaxID=1076179 RepID=A0A644YFF1_9ZZZZ